MRFRYIIVLAGLSLAARAGLADNGVRTGPAAYGDWRTDAPGVRRLISSADLPAPYETRSASNPSRRASRPSAMLPSLLRGDVETRIDKSEGFGDALVNELVEGHAGNDLDDLPNTSSDMLYSHVVPG